MTYEKKELTGQDKEGVTGGVKDVTTKKEGREDTV